ncbi:MAG TPA: methyltransferase domain-containing protein [Geminicoccaceae bacterium]|nr:methyltransferase domain-containing protein [Geminicoccaceae bacterium]
MDAQQRGQVTRSAADVYEEFFVPALFAPWPGRVAQAAGIAPGHAVLDVACGTGVLAREAAKRVQPGGEVIGLDRNEGMLAVARREAPAIAWRLGQAEALPFPDGRFDAVVSQFGLMFFEDRGLALTEMWRVLKPAGRLAVAVWDALERTPGYLAMTELLQRLFGARIAEALRAPFCLGNTAALAGLAAQAGIPAKIATHADVARFPSIEAWVRTDVKGWTLADMIDDEQYGLLQREAAKDLQRFVQPDGSVLFDAPAHILSAIKG